MFPSKFSEQFLGICEFIDDSRNLDFSQEFNNCETTFKKHLEASGLIHKLSRYKRSQFTTSLKENILTGELQNISYIFTKFND